MSERPKLTRRGQVVAATLVGGLLVGGAVGAGEIKQAKERHDAEQFVTNWFSQPNLGEQLASEARQPDVNYFMPAEQVLLYKVEDDDRIYNIATKFGAKNHGRLVDELSGQVGGAGNLMEGDILAIPSDQVSRENWGVDPHNQLNDNSPWVNTGRNTEGAVQALENPAEASVVYATPVETEVQ